MLATTEPTWRGLQRTRHGVVREVRGASAWLEAQHRGAGAGRRGLKRLIGRGRASWTSLMSSTHAAGSAFRLQRLQIYAIAANGSLVPHNLLGMKPIRNKHKQRP